MGILSLELTFDGHRVRMAGTPERPLFVARDICRALYIHNSADALAKCVPSEERGIEIFYTPGGPQQMLVVTEAGLYRLVLRSRKPSAERFRTWMVRDVLPSLRQHGCYPPPAEPRALPLLPALDLETPAALRLLCLSLVERRLADMDTISALRPKAEGYDRLSSAEGLINFQEAGKILGLGPNRLPWRLLDDGILYRGRHSKLLPIQEHVDAGRFVVKARVVDGNEFVQTLVTAKGLTWLQERYPRTDRQISTTELPLLPSGH